MKKINAIVSIAIASFSLPIYAVDGHDGIRFNMSEHEVKAMGFECKPYSIEEFRPAIPTECFHPSMMGAAFGEATRNYSLRIGSSKRVINISAEFVSLRDPSDIHNLMERIPNFFPNENESYIKNDSQNLVIREWAAADKSKVRLIIAADRPGFNGVIKTPIMVTFFSPQDKNIPKSLSDKFLKASRERLKEAR